MAVCFERAMVALVVVGMGMCGGMALAADGVGPRVEGVLPLELVAGCGAVTDGRVLRFPDGYRTSVDLNDAGEMVFLASASPVSARSRRVCVLSSGRLRVGIGDGDVLPGGGGVVYGLYSPALSSDGRIAVPVGLDDGGSRIGALLTGRLEELVTVARLGIPLGPIGDPVTGFLTAGIGGDEYPAIIDGRGRLTVRATWSLNPTTNPPAAFFGIFGQQGSGGAEPLLLLAGPGMTGGAVGLSELRDVADDGTLFFDTTRAPTHAGVLRDGVARAVSGLDPKAEGFGGQRYAREAGYGLAGANGGVLAYVGSPLDSTVPQALVVGDADSVRARARLGESAPGTSGVFTELTSALAVNGRGRVAFCAKANGEWGVWVSDAGMAVRRIIGGGDRVPGTDRVVANATNQPRMPDWISCLSVNERGQVLMELALRTQQFGAAALLAWDERTGLHTIMYPERPLTTPEIPIGRAGNTEVYGQYRAKYPLRVAGTGVSGGMLRSLSDRGTVGFFAQVGGVSTSGTSAYLGAIWTATIPGTCLADVDFDGAVTGRDVLKFLSDYFAGSSRADIDGVAGLSAGDVFAYVRLFGAGCS